MKNYIDRKLTVTTNLTKLAQAFGYTIAESVDDHSHPGYDSKEIREMDMRLSPELSSVNVIFPNLVGQALETVEKEDDYKRSNKARIEAFKKSLELMTPKTVHYHNEDKHGEAISAIAGIISVSINEEADEVTLEIQNPEHLINELIDFQGLRTCPFSSTEEETLASIESKLDYLALFFEDFSQSLVAVVHKESSPFSLDEVFYAEIKSRLADASVEEIASEVRESAEHSDLELKDLVGIATSLTKYTHQEIVGSIKDYYEKKSKQWQ